MNPSVAQGQAPAPRSGPTLEWHGPRFHALEYVATGAMAMGILTAQLTLPEDQTPHWRARLVLDEGGRSALRAPSRQGRGTADALSDLLLVGLQVYPLVVDAGMVAWGHHQAPDVALQMLTINAQSFALTYLVTVGVKHLAGRERPWGRECEPGEQGECEGTSRYQSFISGHTSMAFTGAGLMCAHHANLPLYGDPGRGEAACFTALGAATAVGALRMAADKHYLTDVIFGALVGVLSGYYLPSWLHYSGGSSNSGLDLGGVLVPKASPTELGLSYTRPL